MSVISPCHLRHEVLRPSYVVCFKTPVLGPYHADLSSLRRLGVLAVAAPVLEQLTLAVAGFVVFVTGMIAVVAHHETATLSSHCYRNKNGGFSLMRRVERGRYRPPRRLVDR